MEALAVKVCLPSTSNAGIYWCLEGKASVPICLLGLKPPGFLVSCPSGLLESSKGVVVSTLILCIGTLVYLRFGLIRFAVMLVLFCFSAMQGWVSSPVVELSSCQVCRKSWDFSVPSSGVAGGGGRYPIPVLI